MSTDANDPISPIVVPGHVYGDGSSEAPGVTDYGLTKREYFAALALQGLLADSELGKLDLHLAEHAKSAVRAADLLIKELNETYP